MAASLQFAAVAPAGAAWNLAGPLPGLVKGRIWSVAISPGSPAIAVAGTDQGIFRTLDAARTWEPVGLAGRRVWAVAFDARNANVVYAGTAGLGIQRSVDGGASWLDASSGLSDRNVRSLATGLDGIAAGTGDGVALSADGEHWRGGGPGDQLHGYSISSVAVAANAPQFTVIAGADSGDLSRGFLFRSTPGGAWEVAQAGLPANAIISAVAAGPLSQAVTRRPLVLNTSKGTYRSGDSGNSWTESGGIPKDPAPISLTTAAFSPADPNLVYAAADSGGSAGGELMRSTDGGGSFNPASQGLPDRYRNVAGISVAATSPPQLLAALNDPGGGRLFAETDGSAPSPPSLVPEGTAALPPPAAVAAPVPSGSRPRPTPAPTPSTPGPVARFAGSAFHWPSPLIFELLLAALITLVALRWRHHYLDIEGPP
ncbi:MAG: WD40/YVTN/BNR-like repeat-containing protein [Candidatus Dormibacteria bacterium]